MVTTRKQKHDAAFVHIVENILEAKGDPIESFFKAYGLTNPQDLNNTTHSNIRDCVFKDANGNDTKLTPLECSKIRAFQGYIKYRTALKDPIGDDDWSKITIDLFDAFRSSIYCDPSESMCLKRGTTEELAALATNNSISSTTGTNTTTAPPSRGELYEFRKGIKRDAGVFPTLKDRKEWKTYKIALESQAKAQRVFEVLNPDYVPPDTSDEKELFLEKQTYMYAVFIRTLKVDFAKKATLDFPQDAQKVYKEVCRIAEQSTTAKAHSSVLLSQITSLRWGNAGFTGTAQGFILHWCSLVHDYNDLVDTARQVSDEWKMTMLQNAVETLPELAAVKTTSEMVRNGTDIDFDFYYGLVMSTAETYDIKNSKGTGSKVKRQVYFTEYEANVTQFDDGTYVVNDCPYELDAFAHTRIINGLARMDLSSWNSLSSDDKSVWDSLSETGKRTILTILDDPDKDKPPIVSTQRAPPRKPFQPSRRPPPKKPFSVKHHELDLDSISAAEYLANIHAISHDSEGNFDDDDPHAVTTDVSSITDDITDVQGALSVLAHAFANGTKLPASDIRRVLSNSGGKDGKVVTHKEGQKKTRSVNYAATYSADTHVLYEVSVRDHATKRGALIDRGANGIVAGEDVRVFSHSVVPRFVDIGGIDNHRINDKEILSVCGVMESQRGPVIAVFNQAAFHGKGRTILSAVQMEAFHVAIDDKTMLRGGTQRLTTNDGYVFPLDIVRGLPYVNLRPPSDTELATLAHVHMTSESEWDPSCLDCIISDDQKCYDAISDLQDNPDPEILDLEGNFKFDVNGTDFRDNMADAVDHCLLVHEHRRIELEYFDAVSNFIEHDISVNSRTWAFKTPDYEALRPLLAWIPAERVKKTLEKTTQWAHFPKSTLLKKRSKSSFPALNVRRRDEPVATDTVYSDVPAVDSGVTIAQIFVGTKSLLTDAYPMKRDKDFPAALQDNIREKGAPTQLVSDQAQVDIGRKVLDILRYLVIGSWQSDPEHQNQNPAERRYNNCKSTTNTLINRTGTSPNCWLLCLMYVCMLFNVLSTESLNGETPYRSEIRSALDPKERNLRIDDIFDGEEVQQYIKSLRKSMQDNAEDEPTFDGEPVSTIDGEPTDVKDVGMPQFDPNDLVGRTFLMEPDEEGERQRARIVEAIVNQEQKTRSNKDHIKFKIKVGEEQYDEVMDFAEINDYINRKENDSEAVWNFERIVGYQGPLKKGDPHYKGSRYNIRIELSNGEITTEPLSIIGADSSVICAIYARENDLLELDGWKHFKGIAKREKKMLRRVNHAKLRSFRTSPQYMYGYEVPKNYRRAVERDERNGNTKWQDSTALEMAQLDEYDTFLDLGDSRNPETKPPEGHKKIGVHLIFAIKHDGHHKTRCVANGHLTDTPLESVYSGVVSLRGLRLVLFLTELNGLDTWATAIGNACLEAKTNELVYIVAGPEFGEREGHFLKIFKALYGLKLSGKRWRERLYDVLREMGFTPSKAKADIWMRQNGNVYEYIASYVYNLAIASKDPETITKTLKDIYNFKLKGTSPIEFHLGCDFFRDKYGVLCISPKKYIKKMIEGYVLMFGSNPKMTYSSPLEKGDHPELDTTDFLDEEGTVQYQSMVDSMQWAVSLARFDISAAVMTMSSFRTAPRVGHLERLKHIYGYLAKLPDATIRIRTKEPDYSELPEQNFDRMYTVYGNVEEILPSDAPVPLGKPVRLTHYLDANLQHDMLTGRSTSGILSFVNQTPIDWYCKKQATVESATYGTEFVATRTCVERDVDLRNTLRYLGKPVHKQAYLFGINESVVNSSTTPFAKLHKRHLALSFHRVREAMAAKTIAYYHIRSECNPSDMLSKNWGFSTTWPLLRPLLFWEGDTIHMILSPEENKPSSTRGVTTFTRE